MEEGGRAGALQPPLDSRVGERRSAGDERGGAEALFRIAGEDLVRRVETLGPGGDARFPARVAFALWRAPAAARADSPAPRGRAARGA